MIKELNLNNEQTTEETLTAGNSKNIGKLEGLLNEARRQGKEVTIISVPVELFAIDSDYQTEYRTERDLSYLTKDFRKEKLLPVVGIPHNEEGKIYLVDGYGRWQASQIVDPVKYKELDCLVILKAPDENEPEKRKAYEAEMFAFQEKGHKNLSPLHKHGAYECMNHPAALLINEMKKKYGFEFICRKGKREAGVLGSYNEMFKICSKPYGKEAAEFIFEVCKKSRFDEKANGYATYVIKALHDAFRFFPDKHDEVKEFLSNYLRPLTPQLFRANAVSRYGFLDQRMACSLYLEDLIVEEFGLEHARYIQDKRLVMYPNKKTA